MILRQIDVMKIDNHWSCSQTFYNNENIVTICIPYWKDMINGSYHEYPLENISWITHLIVNVTKDLMKETWYGRCPHKIIWSHTTISWRASHSDSRSTIFRNFRRNIQTISFNKILLQIDLTIWTSSFIHCLSALEQEQK